MGTGPMPYALHYINKDLIASPPGNQNYHNLLN